MHSTASLDTLLYGEAAVSGALFLVCCVDQVFFDALPPTPPSVSAGTPREQGNFLVQVM